MVGGFAVRQHMRVHWGRSLGLGVRGVGGHAVGAAGTGAAEVRVVALGVDGLLPGGAQGRGGRTGGSQFSPSKMRTGGLKSCSQKCGAGINDNDECER